MKVLASTTALQEALSLVGSIVATRTPKPVLQCVKLIAADQTLTLLATDLEVGCRYQITAVQVEEPGEALIPADRLIGIVRESADEDSLTIETEKQAVHIRGAASHFKVFGYDPGEYPAVAEFGEDGDFKITSGELTAMIGRTIFATAKVHSHYAMSGVLWEATGRKLSLVATDGHRLAKANGTLVKAVSKEKTAIAPTKLMTLITRVAGDTDEVLDIRIEENQMLIRTARAVLVSSLVQGNFPKYSDVIPKDCTRKATLNTIGFEHRVRQAALLTNEESRGVRLAFQADQIVLSSRAPETGEATVTCPVSLEGEPMEIAFNPSFLTDALRVVQAESVVMEMNAANKPAVIKAGNDFVYVLMPVDLG